MKILKNVDYVSNCILLLLSYSSCNPVTVGPAYEEPIPAWIDTLNGPTATVAGVGTGKYYRINIFHKHCILLVERRFSRSSLLNELFSSW